MKDEGLDDDERENKQTALSKLPFTRFFVCTASLISLFAELLFILKLFFPDIPSFFFCFFNIRLNVGSWGNSSIPEGRFSKWF